MTSAPSTSDPYGTGEHPEVGELSAYAEGLLSPQQSAAVRRHLAECELCTEVHTSLDEIRDTLGTLPGPPRMPADVAGRIDAALAAEALLDSTRPAEASTASVSRETDGQEQATTPAPVSRETGAVRPTLSEPSGRPPGRGRGTTGPGGRALGRPRRRRLGLLVGAAAVAALGLGGFALQSMTGAPEHHESRSEAAFRDRVQALVADAPSPKAATPPTSAGHQGNSPMHGGATTVPSCVRDGISRTETPLAVDDDVPYRGGSRYLVVLPHAGGDDGRVDAYVVDASCVTKDASGPGDVLLQRTYARR